MVRIGTNHSDRNWHSSQGNLPNFFKQCVGNILHGRVHWKADKVWHLSEKVDYYHDRSRALGLGSLGDEVH